MQLKNTTFAESLKKDIFICGDIGSCHGGKLDWALEAVETAKEIGLDCIKFQLEVSPPNINFTFKDFIKVFERGKEVGIHVTASIFDDALLFDYIDLKPAFLKFAYSQRNLFCLQELCLNSDLTPVVSCDVMTFKEPHEAALKLFCIPAYPVYHPIRFNEIFPKFYGFSDHSLGWDVSLEAINFGAKWIEKHVKLDNKEPNCPDANFALTMKQAAEMVRIFKHERPF